MSNESKILSEAEWHECWSVSPPYGSPTYQTLREHDAALRAQRDELLAMVEHVSEYLGGMPIRDSVTKLITRIKGE